METTPMKPHGIISTAALLLLLGMTVPGYAQDKQEEEAKPDKQEQKRAPETKPKQEEKRTPEAKPAQQEEKKTQPERAVKQEEKRAPQQEQRTQQAQRGGGVRIPADRYQASFGREHTFRVSQADYSNRHFQYGGYSFEFVDAWPSNWLYTQDVFVVEINGVYYLCNANFPGVNIAINYAP
jgi:flagellum-specific peptidoglycan hydrolase FlgJ